MKSHLQKETPNAPEIALRIFISILIILVGIGFFIFFNKTKPKIKKAKPERLPPRVEVVKAVSESRKIIVSALGTVTAEKDIEIKSVLSGEVVFTSSEFIPGGLFKKGGVILKIDPVDYLLEVRRMESHLSSAQAVYDIEMGYQDVAREELNLMEITSGKKVKESGLALRKPQLDQAKAQLDTAKVNLAVARLNHKRTVVRAPFNGMIKSISVNKGSQASPQLKLAAFSGTDVYWVEASIPVSNIDWIEFPGLNNEHGSRVTITTRYNHDGSDVKHMGEVIRLTGSLTEQSRMAKVLINIPDPLALSGAEKITPLILGSYVSLDIDGKTARNIIKLPRKALRDNETVWLMSDNRLSIQSVKMLWKDEHFIYVQNGIKSGDSIIISKLSSPIDGMKLTGQGAASIQDKNEKSGRK